MIRKIIICFIAFFILFFTSNCKFSEKKETKDDYTLKAELVSGVPEKINTEIKMIKSQMNLNNFTFSSLKTGIDTLDVYFGTMEQGSKRGYWVSGVLNDTTLTWSTLSLEKGDTLEFPATNIDIKFNNGTKQVSLKVIHNTETDSITYTWLHNGENSKIASIVDVELPIQINKPLPELELELMNGDTLRTKELSGRHVVINWWNTGCKPCIAAMPKLNNLVEKYKSDSDVYFLAIAFDKRERVENLLNKRDFNFTHTLGDMETAEVFGKSYPKYVILNPEGRVTYYTSGGSEKTYKKIDKVIAEQIE